MGKYEPLARNLASREATDLILSFEDIERMIGQALPPSARKWAGWWANHRDTHVQASEGWLNTGWEVRGVDRRNETVHFHRVRPIPGRDMKVVQAKADFLPTDNAARFLDEVADEMIDYFGHRDDGENLPTFSRQRVGSIPREFDLVSHDGLKVGHAKLSGMGDGERIPTSKLAAISEMVWLLQRAAARERFIVFGKDPRVAQAWLNRYGALADGVTFYFARERGQVQTLTPQPYEAETVVNDD